MAPETTAPIAVESPERWRRAVGYPAYAVSDRGRVMRTMPGKATYEGRMLRTPLDGYGYPAVNLYGNAVRVHVLVARAFLGPIPAGGEVHHKDENRANSVLANLEVTASKRAHGERHRTRHPERQRHADENRVIACACGCGTALWRFDGEGRPRRYAHGHNARKRKAA